MSHGAIPLSRTSFVRDYAPDEWNYDRDGEPDLAAFVLAEQNVKRIGMKRESFEKYEDIEQLLPKFDGENGYDQMLEFRDDVLPKSFRVTYLEAEVWMRSKYNSTVLQEISAI